MSPVSCSLPNLSTSGVKDVMASVMADTSLQYLFQFLVSGNRSQSRICDLLVAGEFPVPLVVGVVQRDDPLSLVQIDHTPINVIILDEESRLPIGRPYVTIVLNTYSRMVHGFFVPLDKPSALSVGIALGNAILPKQPWLDELGVDAEWSYQGIPSCVYVDNAFGFRGKMLRWAGLNWQIDMQWRPLKRPEFGGPIERFMQTMAQSVHDIPGTTFSNVDFGDHEKSPRDLPEPLGKEIGPVIPSDV